MRKNGKIYYRKNKSKLLAKSAKYYVDNKVVVSERVKRYRELNKERRIKYEVEYRQIHRDLIRQKYKENIETYRNNDRIRKAERKQLVNRIQLHYGCRNPGCKWDGDFHPSQLDFHHFDSTKKFERVASMLNYSMKKLAEEINKCIVLCRNCHMFYHSVKLKLDESMLCHVDEKLEIIE
jgi:hypothetical protein